MTSGKDRWGQSSNGLALPNPDKEVEEYETEAKKKLAAAVARDPTMIERLRAKNPYRDLWERPKTAVIDPER